MKRHLTVLLIVALAALTMSAVISVDRAAAQPGSGCSGTGDCWLCCIDWCVFQAGNVICQQDTPIKRFSCCRNYCGQECGV